MACSTKSVSVPLSTRTSTVSTSCPTHAGPALIWPGLPSVELASGPSSESPSIWLQSDHVLPCSTRYDTTPGPPVHVNPIMSAEIPVGTVLSQPTVTATSLSGVSC